MVQTSISKAVPLLTGVHIVKVMNAAARKREELKAKAQEAYYEKHPEERPVPPEPGKPEPTEIDYLKRIADVLEAKKK